MNNIFENAYFGKLYKTRDGRKVVFLRTFVCNGYKHYVSTGELEYSVREDGKVDKNLYPYEEDIVSEWQEEINEEELGELALEEADNYATECTLEDDGSVTEIRYHSKDEENAYAQGFKAGYRKALNL